SAVLVLSVEVLFFGQQLVQRERSQTWIENDIVLEVQNTFDVLQGHVEQKRDTAWKRLQEPDVSNWSCEFDVTHALATNAAQGNFNAALFADDALELHTLVLAAQAFVVLYGAKNTRTEQTIAFRLERTIVDGFWLFDFAVRPGQDFFRRRDRAFHLIKCLHGEPWVERVHDVGMMVHQFSPLSAQAAF